MDPTVNLTTTHVVPTQSGRAAEGTENDKHVAKNPIPDYLRTIFLEPRQQKAINVTRS